jgi:acyl carrier protein
MAAQPRIGASGPTMAMAVEAVNDVLAGRRRTIAHATETTPLDAFGFDSLEVAELFAALEDRCGFELDPDSAQSLLTVADLARLRACRGATTQLL